MCCHIPDARSRHVLEFSFRLSVYLRAPTGVINRSHRREVSTLGGLVCKIESKRDPGRDCV